ncbi:hypothetical protein SLNWT_0801 [Streptomyces albus]|uniref:Uncharacterized protein n=1 Tax=Streptomyces albus (strain ATCC 21838 / DSM 41398 / FERM P-419 / JCM 4703 / NBRC 107858) TaxID=1081613 RepID=A0A0B5ESR0_STRA4|nr:hypothetical protein SLNWT_0801 [Streptomyces albus]AOU75491.1 hypothetical protein SLNHY_0800 [Streptomyces albus]
MVVRARDGRPPAVPGHGGGAAGPVPVRVGDGVQRCGPRGCLQTSLVARRAASWRRGEFDDRP